ncbi:hypothetical protein HYALB_00008822 [Hymenoscyphus albidus]|uniref:Mid2 domain-containing protein n=1 Tax=Hymenoscyphus albidus TaxID=595503 RepID=A0A9N9M6F7_9HELO|nr:hypothetical protein HYALB_00008822 [Hymenoscyphus albidus]
MGLPTFSIIFAFVAVAQVASKTSIYINQLPIYSSLAPCAENRLSVVVRDMSSGCGDGNQLTSFTCFCFDSSTGTVKATTTTTNGRDSGSTAAEASRTTPAPEVEAINVFNSYCERSTELYLYQEKSASTITTASLSTLIITAAPSFTSSASIEMASTTPSQNKLSVPLAAIVAPVVVGVLAIAGIIASLIFWKKKKGVHNSSAEIPNEELEWKMPENRPGLYANQGQEGVEGRHEVATPPYEASGDSIRRKMNIGASPV